MRKANHRILQFLNDNLQISNILRSHSLSDKYHLTRGLFKILTDIGPMSFYAVLHLLQSYHK